MYAHQTKILDGRTNVWERIFEVVLKAVSRTEFSTRATLIWVSSTENSIRATFIGVSTEKMGLQKTHAWDQSTESPIFDAPFWSETGFRARNAGMNEIKSGIQCSAWDHYSQTPKSPI